MTPEASSRRLVVLSLGAGVQSSTLMLMAARGEFDVVPDVAVFADTQWESRATYAHLTWLTGAKHEAWWDGERIRFRAVPGVYVGGAAGLTTHVVTAGDIRAEILEKNTRYASPPFHLRNKRGKKGMTRRQCTKGYKIEPIEKKIRELVGLKPRQRAPKMVIAERWFGISADEVFRMRTSSLPWQEYRHPLIDRRMTRYHCAEWLRRNGYPEPPRSACLGCPFHSDAEWRAIQNGDSREWADVVDFDRRIREVGLKGLRGVPFLHASLQPISQVDLASAEDHGQRNWLSECHGECGV